MYRNHVYDRHTDSESMIVHVDDESDECQESASPMESELGDVYRPVSPLIDAAKKSATIWILKVQPVYNGRDHQRCHWFYPEHTCRYI